MTASSEDLSDLHITEGIMNADRTTARLLTGVSLVAQNVWGTIATWSAFRDGVISVPPVLALIQRMEARFKATEEETRAALVELHAKKLVEFLNEGKQVDRFGTWDLQVTRVLGGPPGSPRFPVWGDS